MADFTVADVIGDARKDLSDLFEGAYAYPTSDMAGYVGEGLIELRGIRPSTRYDKATAKLLEDDDTWSALSDASVAFILPVSPRYRRTLAAYVVFRCLRRDDTDKGNAARAEEFYKRFTETAAM